MSDEARQRQHVAQLRHEASELRRWAKQAHEDLARRRRGFETEQEMCEQPRAEAQRLIEIARRAGQP